MSYLTISKVYAQASELAAEKRTIVLKGTVRVHRSADAGKLQFIWMSDGSTIKEVQVVYHQELEKLDYLAAIQVTGMLIPSPAQGQEWEVLADSVTVVGKCPPKEFPLPRKKLPMTVLRQHPHLRMRTKTMQAILRVRHRLWMAIMQYFDDHGYLSVHTPIISRSDCEGAGETFKVDGGKGFFPEAAFLTVSGQLEGEMAATALGKIFTCGPTFRAEHSDTPRHLSEFWMVEPEMAWYDLDDTIVVAQELIDACIREAQEHCADELELLRDTPLEIQPYKRITYTEAIEIVQQHPERFETVPKWGDDLGTPHERFLVDVYFKCPVVVTHYPKDMKSFYMHQDADGRTVACFDLLLPCIGEVIGGSQREVRQEVLEREMKARKMDMEKYTRYTDLRRFGSMPHSGFGLGFERIVRYVTGADHIRDVIPFPVYYGHLS